MDLSRCFAWLYDRSRKVASIAVIQAALYYGVVTSASHISSAVKNFRPWRGALFRYGEFWAGGAVTAPLLRGLEAGDAALAPLTRMSRYESSGRRS